MPQISSFFLDRCASTLCEHLTRPCHQNIIYSTWPMSTCKRQNIHHLPVDHHIQQALLYYVMLTLIHPLLGSLRNSNRKSNIFRNNLQSSIGKNRSLSSNIKHKQEKGKECDSNIKEGEHDFNRPDQSADCWIVFTKRLFGHATRCSWRSGASGGGGKIAFVK